MRNQHISLLFFLPLIQPFPTPLPREGELEEAENGMSSRESAAACCQLQWEFSSMKIPFKGMFIETKKYSPLSKEVENYNLGRELGRFRQRYRQRA